MQVQSVLIWQFTTDQQIKLNPDAFQVVKTQIIQTQWQF
jgi:hypothetical protein